MGIFKLRIEQKNDCDIWYQLPKICRKAKNCAKQRKNKFWTKNVLFGCFRLKV